MSDFLILEERKGILEKVGIHLEVFSEHGYILRELPLWMKKIDENVIAVYADFYYIGDFDPDEMPYGSLLVYHCDEKKYDYKFTADDIKALESLK